jgi:hypothetical protein
MKPKLMAERGQALILIALAAIGLVAITALAVDGSAKYSDRRHAQNAADASSLAASLQKTNLLTGGATESDCSTASGYTNTAFCQDVIDVAWDRATENGYDGLLSNDVDVYSPPISGPYAGNHNYVQVFITSRVNTFFARVIGIAQTRNIVEAVALAKKGGILGDGAMLVAYDPNPTCGSGLGSGGGSVDVSGSSTVNLDGGGIFLNSQVACGYAGNCPDLTITGGGINSVYGGDNIDQDGCDPAYTAPENPGQDPVVIPDDVEFPVEPPECGMTPQNPAYLGENTVDHKGEWLIYPGYYTQFPHQLLVSNKQHIFMKSGVYCIDPGGPSQGKDLSWSPVDFVELNGSTDPIKNKYQVYNPYGVTLYIKTGGGFTFNANNPTFLDASTDGDYQGYLIVLQGSQSSIETCSITGGSDIDLNGLIFAPYCEITVNGGSDTTAEINAQLIGWHLKVNGNNTINFRYNPDNEVKIHRKVGLIR